MTYKISGKKRRELKETLRRLKYQQERWGHSEVRAARIEDIERSLSEKYDDNNTIRDRINSLSDY